ncbi:hypothetical protein CsSME_00028363 [Camellia sinensis var. sinensis]
MPPLQMQPLAAHIDLAGLGDDVPMDVPTPGPTDPPAPVFMTHADYEALHQKHICLQQSVDILQTDFHAY